MQPTPDELVAAHQHLPRRVVLRVTGRADPDLIQTGHVALITAAQRFNADLEVPFAAFARTKIRWAILEALGYKNHTRPDLTTVDLGDVPEPADPRDRFGPALDRIDIARAVACLPDRERFIARSVLAGRLYQDIAADLGVTPGRVTQILHDLRRTFAA